MIGNSPQRNFQGRRELKQKTPAKQPPGGHGYRIGYARVSTKDQSLEAQIAALERAGVPRDWIWSEKTSGLSRRPMLAKLWQELRAGDTLVLVSLDRLGRDLRDLVNRLHELEQRGVNVESLDGNVDLSNATGRALLGMRAVMAEFERNMTSERTKRTLAHKKAQGELVGRPRSFDRDEAYKLLKSGMTAAQVAEKMGVHRASIYQAFSSDERARLYSAAMRKKAR